MKTSILNMWVYVKGEAWGSVYLISSKGHNYLIGQFSHSEPFKYHLSCKEKQIVADYMKKGRCPIGAFSDINDIFLLKNNLI